MKRYDLTEDGYRRKFRTCKPAEMFQGNARPRMDSVRPLEPEKKLNGGHRAGEAKTSVANQRSCFKWKKTGHIALGTAQLGIVPRIRLVR
ncbi:hypothetical protein PoB_005177000 [Plakobranchus ocellatus]|uniref:Uncharacterized protein n=1 Tax=Plakobranchus ocellatus TaxID=259542 RepID=A0AAV4C0Y3_9GAST|nr:hypothetical protein PoB_005177000 [Plakobranchus ocellatus]